MNNQELCTRDNQRLASTPKASATKLWSSIAVTVAVFDWLFYREEIGVSVAIYGVFLIAMLIWNSPPLAWDVYRSAAVALIAGALAQSAIAINFSNALVLLVFFSLAMVDPVTQATGFRAAIGVLAISSWLRALGRWKYLIQISGGNDSGAAGNSRARAWWCISRIVVPTFCAIVPLAWLMGSGNLLVGRSFTTAINAVDRWLRVLQWPSLDRIGLWCVVATGALTFLWPSIDLRAGALCAKKWPTFALRDETASRGRTWAILGLANALFFWGNGLDACFLWFDAKLPAGVNYSEFVHQGVFALIATALFSALLLTAIFQQHSRVSQHNLTRGLALIWIGQNLFLLSSVGLRLKLYIEAYQLSLLRFYVGSFLVLVAIGYGLLAWRVVSDKSLNWLLAANGVAVFGLFYVLQFIDVGGIVARYNVDEWRQGKSATLDVRYLGGLGSSAWPLLAGIRREAPGTREAIEAGRVLTKAERRFAMDEKRSWRSWQWREARLRNEVFPTSPDPTTPRP